MGLPGAAPRPAESQTLRITNQCALPFCRGEMTSDAEIGVWVDGVQKWVTGVTRRTTCHDVIKALLRAQSVRAEDSDVMQYVIVERWRKVERPLDHEQRILKVGDFELLLLRMIVRNPLSLYNLL